jgi:putative mRNA 3-end processing factor
MPTPVERWLKVTSSGLYCEPGDFFIDPTGRKAKAVVTHGHGDHARPGHKAVLATAETLAIMEARYGDEAGGERQPLAYNAPLRIGDVTVTLVPAGHVLGSAQVVIEHNGARAVISGDYKRRRDPTCPPFEPVPCDVFITEATFGLPVFRHPDDKEEIARLLHSVRINPDRAHVVGVYGLGKCQRVIRLLREAGWDRPLYLHGALQALCDLYERLGVPLGPLKPATGAKKDTLAGQIVLAPPGALSDRWSRRLPEPVSALASGWMRVRQRARQRGIELPLVISDHADWDELTATIDALDPAEIWVTHGAEEALVHYARTKGRNARALSLVGRDAEDAGE